MGDKIEKSLKCDKRLAKRFFAGNELGQIGFPCWELIFALPRFPDKSWSETTGKATNTL